jgi:hypothetical protein
MLNFEVVEFGQCTASRRRIASLVQDAPQCQPGTDSEGAVDWIEFGQCTASRAGMHGQISFLKSNR